MVSYVMMKISPTVDTLWHPRKLLIHHQQLVSAFKIYSSRWLTGCPIKEKSLNWNSVVGLEIHAQINTNSKLFSGSSVSFATPANSQVSLFDCAYPGTLPVLNKKSIEAALYTALALNCNINMVSEFDRKHYFYADMPAGYQITQNRIPFAVDGFVTFGVFSPAFHKTAYKKQSLVKQLQLEQDSGKSLHEPNNTGSLIDLNRAGIGLMEIVFEPDLRNGEEAVALVSELIRILKILDTCNCRMEEGSLRVDANVSVNRPGEVLGTRTEIKNLNSLRAVARSIDYEISRQILILEKGGQVSNETRGYDSALKKTQSMRDKEEKKDYRFLPEPNLLPLNLFQLEMNPFEYKSNIPELPEGKRLMLVEKYQMSLEIAIQLVNGGYTSYFKAVMKAIPNLPAKNVCNLLLTELVGLLHKDGQNIDECCILPEHFAELVELSKNKIITHTASQEILILLFNGDKRSPKQIVKEDKWEMITDQKQLEALCAQIISNNTKSVAAYRSGKTKVFNSLGTQLKKACNGRFDMGHAVSTLRKLLET